MSREAMGYSKNILRVGALSTGAILVAGAAIEAFATYTSEKGKSREAKVISNERESEESLYTISGYHTDGAALNETIDTVLSDIGRTHYAVYPQKGFDIESLKSNILMAREAENFVPTNVLAVSMGGLVLARMFSDPEFAERFGPIKRIVLDSALSGKHDLSAKEKFGIAFGAVLPVTYSTDVLYHNLSHHELTEIDHEDGLSDDVVHIQHTAKSKVPFSAGHHQIDFMRHNDVSEMNLRNLAAKAMEGVVYIASSADNVVDTERASQVYANSLGQNVEYWVDTRRKLNTLHAGAYERPHSALDAMRNVNRSAYDISVKSPIQTQKVLKPRSFRLPQLFARLRTA